MLKYKYQEEYENSNCFWGKVPAKYVKELCSLLDYNLENFNILDLGAGEGKNAVYLAQYGAKIIAVDISDLALSRFEQQPNYSKVNLSITKFIQDIRKISFDESTFDIVVAYGILHCLSTKLEIINYIKKIKNWIKPGGYFVGATFTNQIPVPEFQNYLEEKALVQVGLIQGLFSDWQIIQVIDDIITEVHPTSKIEHQHSIVRIIARKI
ncbi:MAG: class I SAM-dependent methyltransferase [Ignavibacteriae bacterium]|nr:class I SAM-dependent methyltransferase [Ignavibacteriota bacterium]